MESEQSIFDPRMVVPRLEPSLSPWYHFSVDDVFDSLIEVTDRKIALFDHPTFRAYRDLHDAYGFHVSLNVFFQKVIDGKLRTLAEVRNLQEELEEAGSWIVFGPHAKDFDTMPYSQSAEEQMQTFDLIYKEIDRFAGKHNRARWIRLHFYSESYELGNYFRKNGCEALFSTDRPVGSHRMPDAVRIALLTAGHATYEGTNFIRTQFRIEFLVDENATKEKVRGLVRQAVNEYGYIVIYTHEYELARPEVAAMLRTVCEVFFEESVSSVSRL